VPQEMSRQTPKQLEYQAYNPNGVIDFIPHLAGSYNQDPFYQPNIYAQAGFPGYTNAGFPGYTNAVFPGSNNPGFPGYPQPPLGYSYPYPCPAPATLSASNDDAEDLRERINAKIDSILSTQRSNQKKLQDQKTDLLNQKIDTLTHKVQTLSSSISETNADKKLSSLDDAEIARRVRKLASEGKAKSPSQRIPDW